MQVYKAIFKILLKNIGLIIMYIMIFISLSISLANVNTGSTNNYFTKSKVNIAFINHDNNSRIVTGLKKYLSNTNNIIDIPNNKQELQDALFYRKVEYILTVPEGFTEALLTGNILPIEKTTIPDTASGIYIDSIINKYLNTAKLYLNNIENLNEQQLISYINHDLNQETEVKLNNPAEMISAGEKPGYYFNYMTYAMLSILILGVSSVMMVFNNKDLKRRNLCSPVSLKSMNLQMILGHLSFAILIWFTLIFMSFIMYGNYMFTAKGLLLLLNSFIFTFAALSISYLVGNIVNNKNAMSAAANVIGLGTSFISGVFVPQAVLGKTVLRIASFTPNYWYVNSNNMIVDLVNINMENLTPIFINMLIIIGFTLAVFTITLVINKQKRVSKN